MDYSTIVLSGLTVFLGILTIINFFNGRKRQNETEGEKHGELQSDISFIKSLLLEVRDETKEINKTLNSHSVDIAEVKKSVKSAHKRIDEALERIAKLENKGGN